MTDDSIFGGTLAELTYPDLQAAAERGAVVLWGFGVIEQHGPHLPLATDVYLPQATLRRVKALLGGRGVESLIMPPFYWGINEVSASFPGTFEVRPAIMIELMADLIRSLAKDGFRNLFCISGHGDALHNRTLHAGLVRGAAESGIATAFVGLPAFFERLGLAADDPHVLATAPDPAPPPRFLDIHAGRIETSAMLAERPDLVRREIASTLASTDFEMADLLEWRRGREHARAKSPDGYLGDPAAADIRYGDELLSALASRIADAIAGRLAG